MLQPAELLVSGDDPERGPGSRRLEAADICQRADRFRLQQHVVFGMSDGPSTRIRTFLAVALPMPMRSHPARAMRK